MCRYDEGIPWVSYAVREPLQVLADCSIVRMSRHHAE